MEFKRVVGLRRSIRYFQPYRPVEREKVQTVLEAARLCSEAANASWAKAIVVYRDDISEEDRNSLKTPTTTVQLDLAPVWIFWYGDLQAPAMAKKAMKELLEVRAINPSHGWSSSYIDNVVWPQVVEPITQNPAVLAVVTAVEAGLAICQAVLTAVDEGLGTCLSAFNAERAKNILNPPDHLIGLWVQLLGYPAESPEAGGQRPRQDFEELYFEGKYGQPFKRDPGVVENLKTAGMIQVEAPLPWREEEVRALSRMFGLPE